MPLNANRLIKLYFTNSELLKLITYLDSKLHVLIFLDIVVVVVVNEFYYTIS